MQTAAESNLPFTSISSFNRIVRIQLGIAKSDLNRQICEALIRHIDKRQSLHLLADRLIAVADQAYPLRLMETVEQASDLLLGLPLPREYKSIASYYKAFCLKRREEFDGARLLFERVADEATPRYKIRAIIALGSIAFDSGELPSSESFYIEASRAITRTKEFDPLATFYIQSALAILKSIDGNHQGALADLEGMFALARAVSVSHPSIYYTHLNSLAVELLEVGHITEARNVSNIVLASPFADAYPEYRETGRDIELRGRRASRSVVFFAHVNAQNVLRLPSAEHVNSDTSVEPAPDGQMPARVFDLQEWKKKMGKEPNGDHKDSKANQDKTQDEMLYEIMNIFTESDMDWEIRLEMLEAMQKLAAKQRAKKQQQKPDKDSDED